MAMCAAVVVLACFACGGHGRRVQTAQERVQDSSYAQRQKLRPAGNHTPTSHALDDAKKLESEERREKRGLAVALIAFLAPAAAFQIMVAAGKAPGLGPVLARARGRMAATAVSPDDDLSDVYFSQRSRLERTLAAIVAAQPLFWGLRGKRPSVVSALTFLLSALMLHWVVTGLQLDMGHRPKVREYEALAQPESRFGLFSPSSGEDQLRLHWIQETLPRSGEPGAHRPSLVHCNHGFGASGLSWRSCMQRGLGEALGARDVVAHDTPGFGLTERPARDNWDCFTIAGNANLTLELVHASIGAPEKRADADVHFVGHSMGALTAMRAAVDWCETRIRENSTDQAPTLLVLVAPAIPAPRRPSFFPTFVSRKRRWRLLQAALAWMRRRFVFAVTRLAPIMSPLLRLMLRRVVFTRGFWRFGLGACVGNDFKRTNAFGNAVSEYAVPSRLRGWEDGILRFVAGRVREGLTAGSNDIVARAAELTKQGALRVLIVHGKRDPVLPISNSVTLQKRLGPSTIFVGGSEASWDSGNGTALIDFENCGHVPHEEEPERFVQLLREWASTSIPYCKMINVMRQPHA